MYIIRSNILEKHEISDIGLQFPNLERSAHLETGVTLLIHQGDFSFQYNF